MDTKFEIVYPQSKKGSNARDWAVAGGAGLVIATAIAPTPARADGITDITTMVTSLGTIAGAVTTVVLGAMVVRLGIKFVNRMTVKG